MNKSFNIGWGRLRLAFDLYNALNANSIQNVTTTYGTHVAAADDVPGSTPGACDHEPVVLRRALAFG